uniref:Uncharacterized protein n=1 Tax=Anopheles stephensi TaxID=30069 RepID=A0A182YPR0_ANOST
MSRRKSVFVDCDLAQYVEKEENKLKKESANVSFKDDLVLIPRRGTRSQAQLSLDLAENFPESAMKPRDPRRRVLQKRREEELNARENKMQLEAKGVRSTPLSVDKQTIVGMVETPVAAASIKSNKVDKREKQVPSNPPNELLVDSKSKNDEEEKPVEIPEQLQFRKTSVCAISGMK